MSDPAIPRGLQCAPGAKKIAIDWLVGEVYNREGNARSRGVPIYLLLPQSDGEELLSLKERNLLSMTEGGTLDESDTDSVVAVAVDVFQAAYLKRVIFGMRVLPDKTRDFLAKAVASPTAAIATYSRSRVVNLDRVDIGFDPDGTATFVNDILTLCQLREDDPENWALCMWMDPELADSNHIDKLLGSMRSELEEALDSLPELERLIPDLRNVLKRGWSSGGSAFVLLATVIILLSVKLAPEGWRASALRVAALSGSSPDEEVGMLILELSKTGPTAVSPNTAAVTAAAELVNTGLWRVEPSGQSVRLA